MTAKWYQPLLNNDAAKGPRFDTAAKVQAKGFTGEYLYEGTATAMTVGAATLAAAVAGVATGAAALAI